MREASTGLLILFFLFSVACTSVKVKVEYAEGRKIPSTNSNAGSPSGKPVTKAPATKDKLGDSEPCVLCRGDGTSTDPITNICPGKVFADRAMATPQHQDGWCWAASAEMVMDAFGTGQNFEQCQFANQEYFPGRRDANGKPFCCGDGSNKQSELTPDCNLNGMPDFAFDKNNFDWEWWPEPGFEPHFTVKQIARQICKFGPFIYNVLFEGRGGHTITVTDITFEENGLPLEERAEIWIHDHAWVEERIDAITNAVIPEPDPRVPIPIYKISYEEYKNGWLDDEPHEYDFTYFLIKPK